MVPLILRKHPDQVRVRYLGRGRTVLGFLILFTLIPLAASAQTQPAPSWPDINFSTCPAIAAPIGSTQLTWKHGEEERADFAAVYKIKEVRKVPQLLWHL